MANSESINGNSDMIDNEITHETFFSFFFVLYLTSIEIIFTIYNFIYIVLITFAIETN